ncbi:MAG: hypothetical protein AAF740_03570 [Bacteroidota bacterium]
MKAILGLLLVFCSVIGAWAQGIPQAKKLQVVEVTDFSSTERPKNTVFVPMSFAEHKSESEKTPLPTENVTAVRIYYTDYPKGGDFSRLNQWRISEIIQRYPELINVPAEKWQLIKQVELEGEEEARNCFHGVVIQCEEEEKKEVRKVQLPIKPRIERRMERIKKDFIEDGRFEDSIVYRVLERHRDDWKNMVAVCDWTGSVYPFSSQVLHWHKLNTENEVIRGFVFFNDGDETPDDEKVIGSTGGIYMAEADDLDNVVKKMLETMNGGIGGDGPENDLEAILKATEAFPDVDEIILIADNNSSIRDIELYQQLSKPLRIILCGTKKNGVVNSVYLNLARHTGGSVHTIEEDLTTLRLNQFSVGDTLELDSNRFYLSDKDYFIRVPETDEK